MNLETLAKANRPGVMTKFRIDSLDGVDRPAQEGAKVAIIKRDFTADQRREMAESGEAMDAAGDIDAPRRPTLEPGERVNWPATKEANLAQLDTLAKKRAKADGCTFEAAYSKILAENPHVFERFR